MAKHPLYETMGCYKRVGPCCRSKGRVRDSTTHTGTELNALSLKDSSEETLRDPVTTSLPREDQGL